MRRDDLASLTGVSPDEIAPATADEVRAALAGRIPETVLTVATAEGDGVSYWRVGDRYILDDPFYGGPTAFEDLRYDRTLGLHHKSLRSE